MPKSPISYVQECDPWLKRRLVDLVELASGREKLTEIYFKLKEEPFEIPRFFTRAIELGGLNLQYNRYVDQRIPRDGPLVFVANHPFGIVDGLILCELAARTRGDFRILLNNRLMKDEELNQFFLPIDFDGTREATRRNIETKRTAEELLRAGGTLIVFPGGGVATRWRFGLGELEDFPWTTFTAKIIMQSKATVVPVFFEGENSRAFHVASNLSESLRLSLFIREVKRQIDTTIRFTVGDPIPFEQIEDITNRNEMTSFLRDQVEGLSAGGMHPVTEAATASSAGQA